MVYDDKSSASETPAIYSKLLDVDKVDLLFGPYATPCRPLLKSCRWSSSAASVLIGNFAFQVVNARRSATTW